jgi:2-haloacid dehalogenase
MGVEALGLRREDILFVPFAGWDAAGAKWFGYPTFWVNRLGQPEEALDASPDGSGPGLAELVEYVRRKA